MNPVYKTSDGKTFESQEQAVAHNELLDSIRAVNAAQERFLYALAHTQKTADGQMFTLEQSVYFYPRRLFMGGIDVLEVRPWRYGALKFENDKAQVLVSIPTDKPFSIDINELYYSHNAAFLKAREYAIETIKDYVTDTSRTLKINGFHLDVSALFKEIEGEK